MSHKCMCCVENECECSGDRLAAEFLPQRNGEELPAVRVGDSLVFVYVKDGILRVTVDTEDNVGPVSVRVNVNNATVWEGAVE